ncbi:endonuclease/exonuclease/phosphatase family protein [Streptomyces sp. NPDC051921]|uniref:endonuclease/exonuclease/phosphatase family protein n=1 Tax=Streptomyces sp. NPDC051921 TaxID=3155806 RepID=UPI0034435BC7
MRRTMAAFVAALAIVLMAGLGQGGADLLRAGSAGSGQAAESSGAGKRSADTAVAAAGAATLGLKTVSHNICGGQCNQGGTGRLSYITDQIDAYQPHMVMLQEVCWSQYEWFKSHSFASGTYQFGYTGLLTNYTGCGASNCAVNEDTDPNNDDRRCWIGQVVAARGTLSNRDEIALGGERHQIKTNATTGAVEPVNPPRTFTALCYDAALSDLPGRVVKGCSVHLRSFHDPDLINQRARTAQAARLASDLDGDVAAGKIVVVGGDFNSWSDHNRTPAMDALYRSDAAPGGGWGVFYEADQDDANHYGKVGCDAAAKACRSGAPTLVGSQTKYDYLFYSETTDPASVSGYTIDLYVRDAAGNIVKDAAGNDVKVSDHSFYRGLAQVATS